MKQFVISRKSYYNVSHNNNIFLKLKLKITNHINTNLAYITDTRIYSNSLHKSSLIITDNYF